MKLKTIGNESFNVTIKDNAIRIEEKNSDDSFTLVINFDEIDEFIELLQFVNKQIQNV